MHSSPSFFEQLRKHPVPIWGPALSYIATLSMAIDVHTRPSCRLHSLTKPTPISALAPHAQFRAGFKNLGQFKAHFKTAATTAGMVYPFKGGCAQDRPRSPSLATIGRPAVGRRPVEATLGSERGRRFQPALAFCRNRSSTRFGHCPMVRMPVPSGREPEDGRPLRLASLISSSFVPKDGLARTLYGNMAITIGRTTMSAPCAGSGLDHRA